MTTEHLPVMSEEMLEVLELRGHETVVDATFGGGGHSRLILERLGDGARLISIDRDPEAAERASEINDSRFEFTPGAFDSVLRKMVEDGVKADAVLFDLGLSSYQIEDAGRGFSYVQDGPLDMRMDPGAGQAAAEYLNSVDERELARTLTELGDVPRGEARGISREVVRRRPLDSTKDLAEVVRSAVGWKERGGNPAKRVFQAVRMSVNDEMGSLGRALEAAERLLAEGGTLAAITFHSGEDRLVKRFISAREGRCVCPPDLPVCACGSRPTLRRGVVKRPGEAEIQRNPRSASARLRSAMRTAEPLSGSGA